ncbi:hypothetical protein P168DRAFT_284099 [Aspergillus campestris IBT 28561]|uniref:LITAF domain-containing protein n=1 Tax=Aspergillus campestris (strain IBT 28561) TaxID=1392248 RepID=A0A2I1CXN8_ASPC2|nr:uncharacterized protein P168DRAFT_284099 [Aspergillus campestris IBT 28561]PKY02388.1 hypothetical protein P168DRAFT_284099 [Aspergillus campestris IBT 28561]
METSTQPQQYLQPSAPGNDRVAPVELSPNSASPTAPSPPANDSQTKGRRLPRRAPCCADRRGVTVTPRESLRESPALVECQWCHHAGVTRVVQESSGQTGVAALLCCIFCGFIGAVIPYIAKWSYNTHHHCPNCQKVIAILPHDGALEVQRPTPQPQSNRAGPTGKLA